ncbi:hypothetical protein OESDEN_19278 [Oesophagostomum dentatum]|uniref:Uncharacterized protein n=1 Tax=Oesophagostomum dentatum TaxID=61180 RepID=A0A0B1S7Y5_OESDE|nr:hypothetical protein OESDEN_19278 [Oesophagostomum dentatum]
MSAAVPETAKRHNLIAGWPWDVTRIAEYEVLTRLKHCHSSPKITFYTYRSFRDIRTTNNVIFSDEVGNVVLVLPPRETRGSLLLGAIHRSAESVARLWFSCYLVNGPRSSDIHSWDRLNEKAHQHIHTCTDMHPDLLTQVHDLIPAEAGVMKRDMACLMVGVVEDPRRWWQVTQATEFFRYRQNQLKPPISLEDIRVPRSMRSAGKPPESHGKLGKPAIRDGRISKRHLKRVENRKERSLRRATEKALEKCTLGE